MIHYPFDPNDDKFKYDPSTDDYIDELEIDCYVGYPWGRDPATGLEWENPDGEWF